METISKLNLYKSLQPYQIFLLLIKDWRNFLVFYGLLSFLAISNKIIDHKSKLRLKLFGYFVIIICAYSSHIIMYDYENSHNLLPLGITATVILILIEAKNFIKKLQLRARIDLSVFMKTIDSLDKKISNRIEEEIDNETTIPKR